jgi:hypothetical protein
MFERWEEWERNERIGRVGPIGRVGQERKIIQNMVTHTWAGYRQASLHHYAAAGPYGKSPEATQITDHGEKRNTESLSAGSLPLGDALWLRQVRFTITSLPMAERCHPVLFYKACPRKRGAWHGALRREENRGKGEKMDACLRRHDSWKIR